MRGHEGRGGDRRRATTLLTALLVAVLSSLLTFLVWSRLPGEDPRGTEKEVRLPEPSPAPSVPAPPETRRATTLDRAPGLEPERREPRRPPAARPQPPASPPALGAEPPPEPPPPDDVSAGLAETAEESEPSVPSGSDQAESSYEIEAPEIEEESIHRPLSGWVFDRGGGPVPNLVVTAAARRLLSPTGGIGGATAAGPASRTDGEGAFVFPRLLDGEYVVTSQETETYERATATVRAGVNSAVLVVEEKDGQPVRVYGTVESARGGFLDSVRVEPVGQAERSTLTDELGNYALNLSFRAGSSQAVRFLKDGFREERLNVSSAPETGGTLLNARLEPIGRTGRVTGSVMGDDGTPVHLASVQLYTARLRRSHRASSDRDGRFVFEEVEAGDDYRLWVHPKERYRDFVQENVVVTSGGLDLPVVVDSLSNGRLTGRMVSPEGAPISRYALWLVSSSGDTTPRPVRGDGDGRFAVDGVPDGEFVFQTRADPWLSVAGITEPGSGERRVRVVLDLGEHSFGGTVVDDAGRPVGGAQVSLVWSEEESGLRSRSRRERVTDSGGYFLFTQLGAGTHALSVQATGFAGVSLRHAVGASDPETVIRLYEAAP